MIPCSISNLISYYYRDCEGDLICFQREGLEPVPGCSGLGQTSYDYCIVAEVAVVEAAAPMEVTAAPMEVTGAPMDVVDAPMDVVGAPTMTPTVVTPAVVESAFDVQQGAESALPALQIIDGGGKNNKDKDNTGVAAVTSFGLCQGDCYDDTECESGLVCLERDDGESVPGCSGTSDGKNSYCVLTTNGM